MKPVLFAAEMSAMDCRMIDGIGVPSAVLMERAALACAEAVLQLPAMRGERRGPVLVLSGAGNNGGDGFACARILFLKGIPVHVAFAGKREKMTPETRSQCEICGRLGIPVTEELPDVSLFPAVVDALFGIGFAGAPRGKAAEWIQAVNTSGAAVVSVDVPSGIEADTGRAEGPAVRADVTVTMQALKPGLLLPPGAGYAGRVVTAEIGIRTDPLTPEGTRMQVLEKSDLRDLLPPRNPWGNKGDFGKIFIAAGSCGMAGASYLAALGALRCGAGLVRVLAPEENRAILQQLLPEAVLSVYRTEEEAAALTAEGLTWCTSAAVGPGLGRDGRARAILNAFLTSGDEKPLVIDADGLNLLSERERGPVGRAGAVCLTPHVAELGRLLGKTPGEIKLDLIGSAAEAARLFEACVILKDARSVIAQPDGRVWINTSGNDGMATAGSGDVLTGVTAALASSGADKGLFAPCAAMLHGLAGDLAAARTGRYGMKAGDIADCISGIMEDIFK